MRKLALLAALAALVCGPAVAGTPTTIYDHTNTHEMAINSSGQIACSNCGGGSGSNPCASLTGTTAPTSACLMGLLNGGNLEAWAGDSSGRAIVVGAGVAGTPAGGLVTVQGSASMTKLLVTPDSVALPANQSVNESQINGVAPLMGNGVTGTGSQRVTVASDNTPFSVNATSILGTTGGWTPLKLPALTNSAVAVKGSAGQLGKLQCYNPNSSQVYIQEYNVVAGSVTVGTTANLEATPIAPTSTGGWVMDSPGEAFSAAISVAATTGYSNATAPSTAVDCAVAFN